MKPTQIAALATAAATIAVGRVSGGGEAEVTPWLSVGSAELMALDTYCAEVDLGDADFLVIGFELRFDYFEIVTDSSWASDLQLKVQTPNGSIYTIGGLTHQPQSDELWSFDGPESDDPGHYGDDGNDIFLPWKLKPEAVGDFTIFLTNDWSGDPFANLYDLVQIRFYTVGPASCSGDIDLDGTVGFIDLLLLLNAWGPCLDCPEDVDGDGFAAFPDLLLLLFAWGDCG